MEISRLELPAMVLTTNEQDLEKMGNELAPHFPRMAEFGRMLSNPEFITFFQRNFSNREDARNSLILLNPEFQRFFQHNFSNWEDVRNSIMFLNTGISLKESSKQATGHDLTPKQMTALLLAAVNDGPTRQIMASSIKQFIEIPKSDNTRIESNSWAESISEKP